jgi:CheY-like chemotaxis protein
VIEDNPGEQKSIAELLGHDDIEIVSATTGSAGLDILKSEPIDCVVLDLRLPDMSGDEDATLHTMARSIVVKGVESPERLLDETALFLHRVVTELPPEKQRMLERLTSSDEDLVGRSVLVVDDDARNIFALSSVLERRGMKVLTATTGKEAIELIETTPDLAIVLMDIMMPEMDGYQTIQQIRSKPGSRRLPIIALTAKAMKGETARSASRPALPTTSPSRSIPSSSCWRSGCGSTGRRWQCPTTTRSTSCWSTTSRRSCSPTR